MREKQKQNDLLIFFVLLKIKRTPNYYVSFGYRIRRSLSEYVFVSVRRCGRSRYFSRRQSSERADKLYHFPGQMCENDVYFLELARH